MFHKVLMHSMLNSTSYTEPYEMYLTYPPPLGSSPHPQAGSNLESNVHALKRTVVERRMFSPYVICTVLQNLLCVICDAL